MKRIGRYLKLEFIEMRGLQMTSVTQGAIYEVDTPCSCPSCLPPQPSICCEWPRPKQIEYKPAYSSFNGIRERIFNGFALASVAILLVWSVGYLIG